MRKYRQNKNEHNLQSYITARNELKNMCKIKHKQYDEKQLYALIVNINDSFWSKLRTMTNRGRKVENNITTE